MPSEFGVHFLSHAHHKPCCACLPAASSHPFFVTLLQVYNPLEPKLRLVVYIGLRIAALLCRHYGDR